MNVVLPIPDALAEQLAANGGDLARRALEAFAAAEYRAGRLTPAELGALLGYATDDALAAFLSAADGGGAVADDAAGTEGATLRRARAFRRGRTLGGLDPAALIAEGRR